LERRQENDQQGKCEAALKFWGCGRCRRGLHCHK
jgi:hypothetical protein